MLYQKNLEEYQRLQKQISELENQLKTMPEGKLTCARGNHCFKWYNTIKHMRSYIPKSNQKLAEQLAVKKYLQLSLKYLKAEQNALEFYLRHHPASLKNDGETLLVQPGYQELLAPHFKPRKEQIEQWVNADYERNTSHPETLIHPACSGISVRSKSEAMIALFLYSNHIPFRYECALSVNGITLYPDFTILHPKTLKLYYWEHFGLMDEPSYFKNTSSKLQLYFSHGMIPSIQLITTYETKAHPLNYEEISWVASHYFL